MSNRIVGQIGEAYAIDHLVENGYRILERNHTSRWGEIDTICQKDEKIVFIEVKTRIGERRGKPYEAVTYRKLLHQKRAIQYYLQTHPKFLNKQYRFDVISIVLNDNKEVADLQHFENVELG